MCSLIEMNLLLFFSFHETLISKGRGKMFYLKTWWLNIIRFSIGKRSSIDFLVSYFIL